MTNNNEYADIQKLLAELPEITLPDSLRADALFARMDAQQATASEAAPTPAPKANKIIDITRRLRPVLSYAAVFAVLVLVYYGVGVDKMAASPAPAAAPEAFMMAADNAAPASSSASSATASANEDAAAAPRMMMDSPPATPSAAAAPVPEQGVTAAAGSGEMEKAAPRAMKTEAGVPVEELDFGELRATIHQLDSAVTITIARVSDPTTILRTVTQDGSYTYMGKVGSDEAPQLLVATITAADVQPAMVDNLHSYPASGNDRYMLFTVMDSSDSVADATAAVHGSNLILQAVGENNFVVFSDAKPDAAAVDTIKLGSAIIELR